MLAQADIDIDVSFATAVRSDPNLQRKMCDPRENPRAVSFFAFNYCVTHDEEANGVFPLPDPRERAFAMNFLEALDAPRLDPHNIHDEKARRMLHTWIACIYNVWAVQWVPGYTALLLSRSADHVDDGGKDATKKWFSMFGRMKFVYDRLPEHVRRAVVFSTNSAVCPENDAWLMGRAPSEHAGRGGGWSRVFVDECAFVEFMTMIHAAIDPACKRGKVYMSTVNGPSNIFALCKKEKWIGWRFYEEDWKNDPAHTVGIRETEPGPERERYGSHVSDWFIDATASLTDELIGQEYLRRYDKSTDDIVLREFDRSVHVKPRGTCVFDPSRELRVGLDPGHSRKCAATAGQVYGNDEGFRVLGCFEGIHRNSGDNAAALALWLRQVIGFDGPLDDVIMVPDPAALNEELGSGLETYAWFRSVGFSTYELPKIVGPDSVYIGNNVVRVMLQRRMIEIAEEAEGLIQAIPNYRLPKNRTTGEITSNKPIHNMASHPCDSFRYVITSVWTADDLQDLGIPEPLERGKSIRGDHRLLDAFSLRGGRMSESRMTDAPDGDEDDGDEEYDGVPGSGLGARTLTSRLGRMRF